MSLSVKAAQQSFLTGLVDFEKSPVLRFFNQKIVLLAFLSFLVFFPAPALSQATPPSSGSGSVVSEVDDLQEVIAAALAVAVATFGIRMAFMVANRILVKN